MVYVIGDLNGCYNDWKQMIVKIKLRSSDMVFLTGDIIGGSEPMKLLFDLMTRTNVFPVMGYKDLKFSECIAKLAPDATMETFMKGLDSDTMETLAELMSQGARCALEQYLALDESDRESVREYLEEFSLYEEISVAGRDYVLTHSGLAGFDKDKEPDDYQLYDYLISSHEPEDVLYPDRVLIFGHTPTFEFGEKYFGRIIITDYLINVDCGAMYRERGGKLACIRLDDMEEFYI